MQNKRHMRGLGKRLGVASLILGLLGVVLMVFTGCIYDEPSPEPLRTVGAQPTKEVRVEAVAQRIVGEWDCHTRRRDHAGRDLYHNARESGHGRPSAGSGPKQQDTIRLLC